MGGIGAALALGASESPIAPALMKAFTALGLVTVPGSDATNAAGSNVDTGRNSEDAFPITEQVSGRSDGAYLVWE